MRKLMQTSALIVLALSLLIGLGPRLTTASSHREAPLISQDPSADITDVYAFVSPDRPSTVTLIVNVIPFEEPAGGPNFFKFDDNVLYAIRIDNNGDAREEIVYEFTFRTQVRNPNTFLYNTGPLTSLDDPDWNVRQTYTVTRIEPTTGQSRILGSDLATPPVNIGPASTPNYEALAAAAVHDLGNGVIVFAGQRDDPFWVDLGAVFDLLTIRPGAPGDQGGGVDGVGGYNCHTIAIQIPTEQLTKDGRFPTGPDDPDAVIGIWATTSRRTTTVINTDGTRNSTGDWVQVSRLGMPLVNEVVVPIGAKDLFNASHPKDDAQFLAGVTNPELAVLLELLYGAALGPLPPTPRNDLVTVFLTGIPGLNQPPNVTPSEMIRLNTAIPPLRPGDPGYTILGVIGGDISGFPNGRRLYDDVVAIELRAVAGGYVLTPSSNVIPNNLLGDGVHQNDREFLSTFPYVATPWQGFDHIHHRLETGILPTSINESSREGVLPQSFGLFQNFPNPFNPTTQIEYDLPKPGHVKLRIYDIAGQEVRTLVDDETPAGRFSVLWDGMDNRGNRVASGAYFYQIESKGFIQARKMLLLK